MEKEFQTHCAKEEHIEFPIFNNKPSILEVYPFFHRALWCITQVHNFGDIKYTPYSWCNDPEGSDSLLNKSLEAMFRHFLIWKTVDSNDESGYPHTAHLACRCHMLLTRFYRIKFGTCSVKHPNDLEFLKMYRQKYIDPFIVVSTPNLPIFRQISPELTISMLKYKKGMVPTTKELCTSAIWELLWTLVTIKEYKPSGSYFENIHLVDLLFYCISQLLNKDKSFSTYFSNISTN